MRKVLVFGTAFAVASLYGVAVPAAAWTEPGPVGNTPTASKSPEAPERPAGPARPTGGITARAVMVTPLPPETDTYSYGRGARQQLDAYWRPAEAGEGPRPGVLVLHGGYWMAGDKRTWRYIARALTTRGYVVFAANYSLLPKDRWPTQRQDVEAALRYIKSRAHLWNLDPSRVVVLGSSAGGQLATQLGTYGVGSRYVRGVVALSPVVSPHRAYQDGGAPGATPAQVKLRRAVSLLVGCEPDGQDADPRCLDRMDDASPITHAGPGDAPMLLVHGVREFVPVDHSNDLAEALRPTGIQVTVRTVPGEAHGGDLIQDERVKEWVFGWIDSVAKS